MQEAERFVRDLIWAVNSPSLMDLTGHASVGTGPLKASDVDSEHLQAHMIAHREQRVGRYFEHLIAYWIRDIRHCEIVAQSQQLHEGKRTVGEIDLLFRDEQGRVNHWEVACKFYLQIDVGDVPKTDYVGPNANDTLGKKAARLLEHQLPLGVQYFPEIEMRHALVKGRIFYHWKNETQGPMPEELATDHLAGRWMWARELPERLHTSRQRYRILRKPFWLADELAEPSDDDVLSADKATRVLQDHFRSRNTPILISEFRDRTPPLLESERWFVVPNQWPNNK